MTFDPRAAAEEAARQGRTGAKPNGHGPRPADSFTDTELMSVEIADPIFVAEGLLPEGLTLLSGRPKHGKTTLAMNIADAVARGGIALGSIKCQQADVLFLALEDNRRRLRKRRRMMLEAERLDPAPGLTFELEWPRLDDGGLDRLNQVLAHNAAIKLVVIDTWKKITPRRGRNSDDYEHESAAAGLLQKLAAKHQIAILIIHHSRKGTGADDFVDDVLGSTGLTGAVDTIIGFRRKRGSSEAEISVTGRDVDECEKALAGDQKTGLWRILGDAAEHRMSRQRRAIMTLLSDGKLRTIKEIAELLGERYDNVRMNLAHMCDDGQLIRVGKAYGTPGAAAGASRNTQTHEMPKH